MKDEASVMGGGGDRDARVLQTKNALMGHGMKLEDARTIAEVFAGYSEDVQQKASKILGAKGAEADIMGGSKSSGDRSGKGNRSKDEGGGNSVL